VEGSYQHGNEPSGSIKAGKFLSGCTIGGFSRRAQLCKYEIQMQFQMHCGQIMKNISIWAGYVFIIFT
jgi:hypothetical protein